jgi:hypothetical protein
MATELNEYYQMRRKLNLSFTEAAQALSPERELLLASNRAELTSDDKTRLALFAEQRDSDRKAAVEEARAAHRRYWGA